MRGWILLALFFTLARAESSTTESTGKSSDSKEKRTPAAETSVQNPEYSDQVENLRSQSSASAAGKNQISYVPQDQAPRGATVPAGAQVTYIPLRSIQGQYAPGEQRGRTFTVQYVPASSIYRSAGNSQKYELVSRPQQAAIKTPGANSLVYITQGHSNSAAQTAASPPQSSGGIVYTLQPLVMSFALPGNHYVTPHNPLLPVFGSSAVPPVLYYPQRQPAGLVYAQQQPATLAYSQQQPSALTYAQQQPAGLVYSQQQPAALPYTQQQPVALPYAQQPSAGPAYAQHQPAAQRQQVAYVLPYTALANQRLQQQALIPRTAAGGSSYASPEAYRVSIPQFQQVKG